MRLPSKSATFAILMVASAVSAFLVPSSWTAPVRGVFQPLGLVQWMFSSSGREAGAVVNGAGGQRVTQERARELLKENEELKTQVVNQQQMIDEFQAQLDQVTALRGQVPYSQARIVLAPVVSYDASPARDTLQIALNERTSSLIKVGQWVAAGVPETPTRELLCRQWLIGRVSEVHTRLARVQLATDPKFRAGVQAGRLAGQSAGNQWRLELADEACVLDGQGGGKMLISQAKENYFESGNQLVGVPASRDLPAPFVLGRIVAAKHRDDSSKHYDLTVIPWGSVERLTHVYVISMEP